MGLVFEIAIYILAAVGFLVVLFVVLLAIGGKHINFQSKKRAFKVK